jgi:hypothetical protein
MQSFRSNERFPRGTWLLVAVAFAAPSLAGCACDDAEWRTAVIAGDAEAATPDGAPNCDFGSLNRLSKASATFAERADPKLLEIARLEAERDCYKAAEVRARQRS